MDPCTGSSPRMWGTREPGPSSRDLTVHPHACGELPGKYVFVDSVFGSSPRMWGTLCDQCLGGHRTGSSPRMWGTRVSPGSVHSDRGSSPRMWGTQQICICAPGISRFIPTHVGNSFVILQSSSGSGSSPRMWGTPFSTQLPTSILGSSPRMWGTRARHTPHPPHPAVHPHACGELRCSPRRESSYCGSSPRMWGTLAGNPGGMIVNRFIPTHVGNS